MPRHVLTTYSPDGLDERLVRCAEHNTAFYAAYPPGWDLSRVLRTLAERFQHQGHRHVAFETIDLSGFGQPVTTDPVPVARPAGPSGTGQSGPAARELRERPWRRQ
jgi:hypothetical protein